MKRPLLFILVLLLFVMPQKMSSAVDDGPQPVFVKKSFSQMKSYQLELYGTFTYEKVSNIYAPIVGIVRAMKVQKGEQVSRGQILVAISRDDPGFTRKETTIKAPFNGIVQSIAAYEGVRFSPQSPPLLTLAAYHPLYLYADVLESDLSKINMEDVVTVWIQYLDRSVQGRITGMLDVDPARRMARIKVKVLNSDAAIKAGTEGKINYAYKQERIVLIPAEAVFPENGHYYVWIHDNGRAARREVKVGELQADSIEVLSGINEGEDIIYYGYLDLEEGSRVTIGESLESKNEF